MNPDASETGLQEELRFKLGEFNRITSRRSWQVLDNGTQQRLKDAVSNLSASNIEAAIQLLATFNQAETAYRDALRKAYSGNATDEEIEQKEQEAANQFRATVEQLL